MNIPCISELLGENYEITNSIILLIGPPTSGKSSLCKQFYKQNFNRNSLNFYISTNLSLKQFNSLLNQTNIIKSKNFFINPFLKKTLPMDDSNSNDTLDQIYETINKEINKEIKENTQTPIFLVFDSLTQFFSEYPEQNVINLLNRLSLLLQEYNTVAIFTTNSSNGVNDPLINKIASFFNGIIEMRIVDLSDNVKRQIRILSMEKYNVTPKWFDISLNEKYTISVENKNEFICSLCNTPIKENPQFYYELAFHEKHLEVYKKLIGAYGTKNLSGASGATSVTHANFFFVDIVGLSNPFLSVRKQIEKIELLNNMINSCNAFKKNNGKKVLPTGDGMAIAFTINPELPIKLSIELHEKLNKYNKNLNENNKLGIRIGLASGPVFIVNDINNNENMWGPGIVFARRVMDIGDNKHILMEGVIAELMINLDEKYRNIIHVLGNYKIKHSQIIKLFSVHSDTIGNSVIPKKFQMN
ncbi:MAG: ATPase domain-containing protein [Nitrososphaeraceae archaeon]